MNRLVVIAVMMGFLGACGGGGSSGSGSGVSPGKRIVDLSASEESDLCDYIVDVQDGPRTVVCDANTTVSFNGKADCLTDNNAFSTSCAATVAQAEDCAEQTGADPCGDIPSVCAVFFTCTPG